MTRTSPAWLSQPDVLVTTSFLRQRTRRLIYRSRRAKTNGSFSKQPRPTAVFSSSELPALSPLGPLSLSKLCTKGELSFIIKVYFVFKKFYFALASGTVVFQVQVKLIIVHWQINLLVLLRRLVVLVKLEFTRPKSAPWLLFTRLGMASRTRHAPTTP